MVVSPQAEVREVKDHPSTEAPPVGQSSHSAARNRFWEATYRNLGLKAGRGTSR